MTDATAQEEFDGAALDRLLRFGGPKLLASMVEMFRVQGPSRLASAREAVVAGDGAAAKLAFHSLKSSAAQMGAMHLSRLCGTAEDLAREEQIDALPPMLDPLDEACARAVAWMTQPRSPEGSA